MKTTLQRAVTDMEHNTMRPEPKHVFHNGDTIDVPYKTAIRVVDRGVLLSLSPFYPRSDYYTVTVAIEFIDRLKTYGGMTNLIAFSITLPVYTVSDGGKSVVRVTTTEGYDDIAECHEEKLILNLRRLWDAVLHAIGEAYWALYDNE